MISLIAAIGSHRELGLNNKLLWNIPEDLARFKKITLGHPVIMGRKTFQSIGKPLPNRLNIVVTHDQNFKAPPKVLICNSLEEAINTAKKSETDEIFIIGGASIYQQAIAFADKLYLTVVKARLPARQGTFTADAFFPDYSQFKKIIFQEKHQTDKYVFTFIELVR